MEISISKEAVKVIEKLLFKENGSIRLWAQCALWMTVVIEAAFVWSLLR